jgi:hypothetical protein
MEVSDLKLHFRYLCISFSGDLNSGGMREVGSVNRCALMVVWIGGRLPTAATCGEIEVAVAARWMAPSTDPRCFSSTTRTVCRWSAASENIPIPYSSFSCDGLRSYGFRIVVRASFCFHVVGGWYNISDLC